MQALKAQMCRSWKIGLTVNWIFVLQETIKRPREQSSIPRRQTESDAYEPTVHKHRRAQKKSLGADPKPPII